VLFQVHFQSLPYSERFESGGQASGPELRRSSLVSGVRAIASTALVLHVVAHLLAKTLSKFFFYGPTGPATRSSQVVRVPRKIARFRFRGEASNGELSMGPKYLSEGQRREIKEKKKDITKKRNIRRINCRFLHCGLRQTSKKSSPIFVPVRVKRRNSRARRR